MGASSDVEKIFLENQEREQALRNLLKTRPSESRDVSHQAPSYFVDCSQVDDFKYRYGSSSLMLGCLDDFFYCCYTAVVPVLCWLTWKYLDRQHEAFGVKTATARSRREYY